MWRIIIIAFTVFFCSCNQKKELSKSQIDKDETNFYDLYALKIIEKQSSSERKLKIINSDSLFKIKSNNELLVRAINTIKIDSIIAENYKVEFSEKIKNMFENSNGKVLINLAFSKPYFLDTNHSFILSQKDNLGGGVFEIIYFSKNNNYWKLDSINKLINYKGPYFDIKYSP